MSSVRMCDGCTEIFSENAEGWATQTATIQRRDPNTGRLVSATAQLDKCPNCVELEMGRSANARPTTMLTAQPHYETQEGDTP